MTALDQAALALMRGASATGLALAERAHQLRPPDDSWRLLAWAHLLERDFRAAWRCWMSRRREQAETPIGPENS